MRRYQWEELVALIQRHPPSPCRLSISLWRGLVISRRAARYRKSPTVKTCYSSEPLSTTFYLIMLFLSHFYRALPSALQRDSRNTPFLLLSVPICFTSSFYYVGFALSAGHGEQRVTSICSRKLNLHDIPGEGLVTGDY